jgi:hypothetical protein|tara:strand:- start:583 stop:765 length:183 start_codon:yes stop_codon:yes gene_type:complete
METRQKVFTAGVLDFLAVALILLKVTGLTSIPWIWVLAPWWIPITITLGILTAAALTGGE